MTPEAAGESVDELYDLLDQERSALLSGDLDSIARLHARKQTLIEALNLSKKADAQDLRILQDKAATNQALLNSALDGIRSVTRRLATVHRVRQSLEFYGEDGNRSAVHVDINRSVEKRA